MSFLLFRLILSKRLVLLEQPLVLIVQVMQLRDVRLLSHPSLCLYHLIRLEVAQVLQRL